VIRQSSLDRAGIRIKFEPERVIGLAHAGVLRSSPATTATKKT
jgi:hypothetical protein